jgi:hypothetical protein
MNTPTKTMMAVLGGTAALAVTVGFGGLGASPVGDPSTPATHPSSSVAPALPDPASPASSGGVHIATLTGCISGANC